MIHLEPDDPPLDLGSLILNPAGLPTVSAGEETSGLFDDTPYSSFLVDEVRLNKLNSLITRGLSPLPVLRWHENR